MKDLIISLEATCDLPENLIKKYDLKIADMEFIVDDEIYSTNKDNVQSSHLYEKMRKGSKTKTSQINEESYIEFFEKLLKENKPILHLAFSSGQSATYHSAVSAANKIKEKYKDSKIIVVDSLCSCSGHGFYAILVRKFADDANSLDDVVKYAEYLKYKIIHSFSVDDLKYLYRGGRIKQSVAIIGTILKIKPVLKVDDDGRLVQVKNVVSRKRALKAIYDGFKESYDKNFDICFISHADCLVDAEYIANLIKDETNVNPTITNLGPIIGSHSGPGTIALFFVASKR